MKIELMLTFLSEMVSVLRNNVSLSNFNRICLNQENYVMKSNFITFCCNCSCITLTNMVTAPLLPKYWVLFSSRLCKCGLAFILTQKSEKVKTWALRADGHFSYQFVNFIFSKYSQQGHVPYWGYGGPISWYSNRHVFFTLTPLIDWLIEKTCKGPPLRAFKHSIYYNVTFLLVHYLM